MKRWPLLVVATLAVACVSCDSQQTSRVPVGDSPVRGPADAWVTIVEFADFECPYCGRAAPTVASIGQAYPDDVRLIFKHYPLPFHPRAEPAALAAVCAMAQGAFWPMHDLLFANQKALEDSDLEGYASSLALDLPSWHTCLQDPASAALIQDDVTSGDNAGVTGTPTFFINGKALEGAQPYDVFAQAVEKARATAEASGIPRADYYTRAVLGQ
jgi:protein-disulfide isomerase